LPLDLPKLLFQERLNNMEYVTKRLPPFLHAVGRNPENSVQLFYIYFDVQYNSSAGPGITRCITIPLNKSSVLNIPFKHNRFHLIFRLRKLHIYRIPEQILIFPGFICVQIA